MIDVGDGATVELSPVPRTGGAGPSVVVVEGVDDGVVVVDADVVVVCEVVLGKTVVIDVTTTLLTHPTSKHTKPGTQHAPPRLCGQAVCPAAQCVIFPLQDCPAGQQPTGPSPVSVIETQDSEEAQQ